MDAGLEKVIRRALEDARAVGREARPDLTASEILAAVNMVRQS
jgi:hypothetical protein